MGQHDKAYIKKFQEEDIGRECEAILISYLDTLRRDVKILKLYQGMVKRPIRKAFFIGLGWVISVHISHREVEDTVTELIGKIRNFRKKFNFYEVV